MDAPGYPRRPLDGACRRQSSCGPRIGGTSAFPCGTLASASTSPVLRHAKPSAGSSSTPSPSSTRTRRAARADDIVVRRIGAAVGPPVLLLGRRQLIAGRWRSCRTAAHVPRLVRHEPERSRTDVAAHARGPAAAPVARQRARGRGCSKRALRSPRLGRTKCRALRGRRGVGRACGALAARRTPPAQPGRPRPAPSATGPSRAVLHAARPAAPLICRSRALEPSSAPTGASRCSPVGRGSARRARPGAPSRRPTALLLSPAPGARPGQSRRHRQGRRPCARVGRRRAVEPPRVADRPRAHARGVIDVVADRLVEAPTTPARRGRASAPRPTCRRTRSDGARTTAAAPPAGEAVTRGNRPWLGELVVRPRATRGGALRRGRRSPAARRRPRLARERELSRRVAAGPAAVRCGRDGRSRRAATKQPWSSIHICDSLSFLV